MSAPRYTVETIRGNLALLTENPAFGQALVAVANGMNLEVTVYTLAELQSLSAQSHALPTPDSWLIDLTPALGTQIFGEGRGVWSTLTSYPHPHLYILEKSWEQLPIELPSHATRVITGEYLGAGGGGAPTLTQLASMLATRNVTLGEGGLSTLYLMSEEYFLRCLLTLCEQANKAPQITLASPDGISLSALAQHLQETRPHSSFTLHFADSGLVVATPPGFHQTTHALFEKISAPSSLDLALAYLETPGEQPKVVLPPPAHSLDPTPAPPEPKTRLPKLTPTLPQPEPTQPKAPPRNLTSLEFVPLRRSRPARRFTLPTLLKRRGLRLALRGILLGFILYLGSLALALGITLVTLKNLQANLESQNINNLHPEPIALFMGKYLYSNAVAFNHAELIKLFDLYQQVLTLSSTASSLTADVKSLATYILSDGGDDLAATLTSTRLGIEDLYSQLSLLDGSLPVETPRLLKKQDKSYQMLKQALPELKKQTLHAKGVASILPEIIAVGTRSKYLILFQNNMELRPTGGFIGSYGLVSFENGKLYDFQVYDVYAADGQLKGHVEPPEPIKKILGEAKWYLRDSNFDPDFPTSARRAEWFLKKSMNQDVQGTIAINLETLKGLLQVIGPLELADYNETVNMNNLAERAQFHAEVNFFPGSTAKKEFLSSVGDALFQKLKEADASKLITLSSVLVKTLESSDTQLSSTNEGTERVLQTLGWNGGIENKPCPSAPCYDDYLYLVDSNFGVNKANFYITKDVAVNVAVDKDGIPENSVVTTWTNSATSNAWPAGSYKNFTRAYLPSGATIKSLKLGDTLLTPSDYTVSNEHGRTIVSYLLTVPIDSTTTSTLTYTLSTPLKAGTLYSLYVQRQSGIRAADSVKVTLDLPLYLKPTRLSPEPTALSPQQLTFSFFSDADHRVAVQF